MAKGCDWGYEGGVARAGAELAHEGTEWAGGWRTWLAGTLAGGGRTVVEEALGPLPPSSAGWRRPLVGAGCGAFVSG